MLSENVVSMCIEEQLQQNDRHDSYQSGYLVLALYKHALLYIIYIYLFIFVLTLRLGTYK